MKARFIKNSAMRDLRAQVAINLRRYQSGDFSELLDKANLGGMYFELNDSEADLDLLAKLEGPETNDLKEAHNAHIVYRAIKVTPYQAKDERLWVYLCHTAGLDFIRKRHPKIMSPNKDEAVKEIIQRFFIVNGHRGYERSNALARLWSYGDLASKNKGVKLDRTLEVFLYQTDVRAQIIERPSTFTNPNVFAATMRFMFAKYKSEEKRKKFFNRKEGEMPAYRRLFTRLNELGGIMLLGAIPPQDLDRLVMSAAKQVGAD